MEIGEPCNENIDCKSNACVDNFCYECADDSYCEAGNICGNNETHENVCCQKAQFGYETCTECPAGKYDHDRNIKTVCQECPAGMYQDSEKGTICDICPQGWQSATGQSECTKIDYCGSQVDVYPVVPHKCANSECNTTEDGYRCGKCTDRSTWLEYDKHARFKQTVGILKNSRSVGHSSNCLLYTSPSPRDRG